MPVMLNERAQILLKTLVERYIAEGQPVGSRTLSQAIPAWICRPASIRNVMADLEEMGFVASPHTSAGRMPTPRGYRFFVDTLLTVRPLDQVEINQLEDQLQPRPYAEAGAVRIAPAVGPDPFRRRRHDAAPPLDRRSATSSSCSCRTSASCSSSSPRTATCRTASCFTDRTYSPSELIEAANFLNQNFAGFTFEQIKEPPARRAEASCATT